MYERTYAPDSTILILDMLRDNGIVPNVASRRTNANAHLAGGFKDGYFHSSRVGGSNIALAAE